MKTSMWVLSVVVFALGVPTGVIAQDPDCGPCETWVYPWPPADTVHQFKSAGEHTHECENKLPHAEHDCEDGDGDQWDLDSCDKMHEGCPWGDLEELSAMADGDRVTPAVAAYVAWKHSGQVALQRDKLQFMNCDGTLYQYFIQENRPRFP